MAILQFSPTTNRVEILVLLCCRNGIPEDPVTGSAHTVLAPYWGSELGLTSLTARQCSPRGGDLHLTIIQGSRLHLAGEAVVVVTGVINLKK